MRHDTWDEAKQVAMVLWLWHTGAGIALAVVVTGILMLANGVDEVSKWWTRKKYLRDLARFGGEP